VLTSIKRLLRGHELGDEDLLIEARVIREHLRDRPYPEPDDDLSGPAGEAVPEVIP
jgi:hypothetical protein